MARIWPERCEDFDEFMRRLRDSKEDTMRELRENHYAVMLDGVVDLEHNTNTESTTMHWVLIYTDNREPKGRIERRPHSLSNALGVMSAWLKPHERTDDVHIDMVNNSMRIVCSHNGHPTAVFNLFQE